MKAIIPAADYLFMCRFVSQEETRHYLQGVCCEPGPLLVATDGHRLGVMKLAPDEGYFSGDPFILKADKALIRACKGGKHDKFFLLCEEKQVRVVLVPPRYSMTVKDLLNWTDGVPFPADGLYIADTFPNWRRVIPGKFNPAPETRLYRLDASLLNSFQCGQGGVWFSSLGPEDPLCVLNSDPRFFGVLMPMRGATKTDISARRADILGKEVTP